MTYRFPVRCQKFDLQLIDLVSKIIFIVDHIHAFILH